MQEGTTLKGVGSFEPMNHQFRSSAQHSNQKDKSDGADYIGLNSTRYEALIFHK